MTPFAVGLGAFTDLDKGLTSVEVESLFTSISEALTAVASLAAVAGRGQFAKCGVYLLGRRFELSGEFIGHRGSTFVRERAVHGDAQVFNSHLDDCCFLDW